MVFLMLLAWPLFVSGIFFPGTVSSPWTVLAPCPPLVGAPSGSEARRDREGARTEKVCSDTGRPTVEVCSESGRNALFWQPYT